MQWPWEFQNPEPQFKVLLNVLIKKKGLECEMHLLKEHLFLKCEREKLSPPIGNSGLWLTW